MLLLLSPGSLLGGHWYIEIQVQIESVLFHKGRIEWGKNFYWPTAFISRRRKSSWHYFLIEFPSKIVQTVSCSQLAGQEAEGLFKAPFLPNFKEMNALKMH